MSSRPVTCSGRLKARQPFLVCYYYAIKDSCSNDTITELPFGFQDGNETKNGGDFSELNASFGQPVCYLTCQPGIHIL